MANGEQVRSEGATDLGRGEGARGKLGHRVHELTWQQFDEAVGIIADHSPNVGSIYGVARGGLVLAVAVSHRLNVPVIDCIRPDTLVLDDVVETGLTMLSLTKGAAFWAWINKSGLEVDAVMTLPGDAWIVFPWEDAGRAQMDADAYYASRKRDI